jgi:hypothetical protein
MNSVFSSQNDISLPQISLGKDDRAFNFFMFILILIIFIIVIIPWNKIEKKKENMSGGTLTQLFANDSQDVYLKGNVDKLATGNFDLYWNQPTRVANTYLNRGSPLPTFILPDTPMNPNNYPITVSNNYTDSILNNTDKSINSFKNPILINKNRSKDSEIVNSEKSQYMDYLIQPKENKYTNSVPTIPQNILPSSLPLPNNPNMPNNPYELAFAAKQVTKTKELADNLPPMTKWLPKDYLFQSMYDKTLYNKNCLKDPASCGTNSGGYRLADGFVQSTKALPNVNLNGDYFYPDSYTGSYFIEPNFDIVKPYPFIPNNNIA